MAAQATVLRRARRTERASSPLNRAWKMSTTVVEESAFSAALKFAMAAAGIAAVFLGMLVLSLIRTHLTKKS
jgi:hypothetical protein